MYRRWPTSAASFGNLDRVSYVLPPFGWSLAAASVLAASLLVLAVAARIASRRTVSGSPGAVRDAVAPAPYRRLRAYAVAFGLATAVALSLAGASLFERSRPRFVCLGGIARTVPSALAESGRDIEPGVSGRILRFAGDWSFVEFDDGSAAWLSSGDIVRY